MQVILRAGRPEDAEACGRICYEAFKNISEKHNFPPDFPTPEPALGLLAHLLSRVGDLLVDGCAAFFRERLERHGDLRALGQGNERAGMDVLKDADGAVARLGAAEDACDRVVVLLRDRIELVIVAARTRRSARPPHPSGTAAGSAHRATSDQ